MERVAGDVELLRELVTMLRESVPVQLTALREAVTSGDARRVERVAHAIKGSVGNFAAQSAFATALRLEKMGRQGDLADTGEALRQLEAEIEELSRALAALVAQDPA
jgi:HPt (histidine-containing phosphotransfer) domain-containing protein